MSNYKETQAEFLGRRMDVEGIHIPDIIKGIKEAALATHGEGGHFTHECLTLDEWEVEISRSINGRRVETADGVHFTATGENACDVKAKILPTGMWEVTGYSKRYERSVARMKAGEGIMLRPGIRGKVAEMLGIKPTAAYQYAFDAAVLSLGL